MMIAENELMYVRRRYAGIMEDRFRQEYAGIKQVDEKGTRYVMTLSFLRESTFPFEYNYFPENFVKQARKERIDLITEQLKRGLPVQPEVLREYPSGTFIDQTTAPVGTNPLLSDTLPTNSELEVYGCRLKRQNGMPVSAEEQAGISIGLEQLWQAIGDLSDLCHATGVVIAHTAGRRILHKKKNVLGTFDSFSNEIVVGASGISGLVSIASLAHELAGHWLDQIGMPPTRWVHNLISEDLAFSRKAIAVSFLDAWLRRDESLLSQAMWRTNHFSSPRVYAKDTLLKPSEVWARLVEQWVAWKLSRKKIREPQCVDSLTHYFHTSYYWDEENWPLLADRVEEQIHARIWMARIMAGILKYNRYVPLPSYQKAFPWSKGHELAMMSESILESKFLYETRPMKGNAQEGNSPDNSVMDLSLPGTEPAHQLPLWNDQ
jgi:hypothetical protein